MRIDFLSLVDLTVKRWFLHSFCYSLILIIYSGGILVMVKLIVFLKGNLVTLVWGNTFIDKFNHLLRHNDIQFFFFSLLMKGNKLRTLYLIYKCTRMFIPKRDHVHFLYSWISFINSLLLGLYACILKPAEFSFILFHWADLLRMDWYFQWHNNINIARYVRHKLR